MPTAYEERILFHILPTAKYFIIRKDYFISHSDISLHTMFRIDLLSLLCYNTQRGGDEMFLIELIGDMIFDAWFEFLAWIVPTNKFGKIYMKRKI